MFAIWRTVDQGRPGLWLAEDADLHTMRPSMAVLLLCCSSCVLQTQSIGPEVRISFCAKKGKVAERKQQQQQQQQLSAQQLRTFLQAVAVQKTVSRL